MSDLLCLHVFMVDGVMHVCYRDFTHTGRHESRDEVRWD